MAAPIPPVPRTVYAYVDGFNLYHRVLENHTGRKWLNLRALIQSRFPNDTVARVRLFTAPVGDHHPTSEKRKRQEAYWRALRDTGVEVELGRIESRERKCKADICGKYLSFAHPTEKMSDVSMALRIVTDAIDSPPGIVCVVTADLDVLPALKMLKERGVKARRCLFLPGGDPAHYYSRLENFGGIASLGQLTGSDVENFQFTDPYVLNNGHTLSKPAGW
ncbi:MAG: hypothetical protein C0502_00235 [Opitutus sp.]|nr:hypothetical protein [Opitutus sp.]